MRSESCRRQSRFLFRRTMRPDVAAVAVLLFAALCDALVVPDEVPTLLSLIYSNIPTLKKGTDSRLGWGFRFGDRADFQVLVELGPQKETQPLANQADDAAHKRAAPHTLANALYAQSLRNNDDDEDDEVISQTKGGEFIAQWADDVRPRPTKFTLGVGEVHAKDYIPEDEDGEDRRARLRSAAELLAEMYREKERRAIVAAERTSTAKPPKTTTGWKDALDNVDVE